MTEPYHSPLSGPEQRPPRYEVCRGPVMHRWTFRAFVADLWIAERILARWRQEHPNDAQAILMDGRLQEDEERKRRRLEWERINREAAYFEGLAVEAQHDGKPERVAYYRRCAAGFLRGTCDPEERDRRTPR
jgi:hypothetical protein